MTLAAGSSPPAPRLAATVLLLRPAPGGQLRGCEVFLQRRAAGMVFAAGMYVFPGGVVDPVDLAGPALPGDWPGRLGHPEPAASGLVRAAVREVAEETGVRLAPGDLVPWSRWITPEAEPRRYDTSFFVAALPEGAEPAGSSGETDHVVWLALGEAASRARNGELAMLPPTVATLAELAPCGSVAAVVVAAAGRDAATPVRPRLVYDPDGKVQVVW